jgi:processing peptidase subunit beta
MQSVASIGKLSKGIQTLNRGISSKIGMKKPFSLPNAKFANFKQATLINQIGSRNASGMKKSSSKSEDYPSYLYQTNPYQVTTLSNQFRVASEYIPGETATLTLYMDVGSRLENEKNNGAAHFIEHLNFKGTSKRTRHQLETEVENIGANLNAYTSRENQVFTARVFKTDVAQAVDILHDIVLNSNLSKEAVEAERQTILREAEEVQKDEQEVVFDYLHAGAFQGTPLGRNILGAEENIKTISREDLINFRNENYYANRMVLVGTGAIKHEELVALGNKYFGSVQSKNTINGHPQKTPFTGNLVTVRDDYMDEAHIVVATEGVNSTNPDYFTLQLIQTIIGNWDRNIGGGKNLGSRLCELVATEDLVSSLNSFMSCYNDTGLFGQYVTVKGEDIEDAIWEILNEWTRIANSARESEVERAKQRMKSAIMMQLDGTNAIAEDIGRQLISYGRRMTPAEIFMRIDAITPQDVMRVAQERLQDVDLSIAAIGPVEAFPDYNRVRAWTYWNRW